MGSSGFFGPVRPGLQLLRRPPPPPPPPWPEEVERVAGLPLLRLTGDAEERGRRHGRVLAAQVDHLLRHYLGPFTGTEAGRERFGRIARRMEPFLTEEERQELAGLARGAGDDLDRVLVGNTFLDAHKTALCSTVVVRHRSTGEPLFGRNLDFVSFGVADRMGIVLVHEPSTGAPFVTVGWPGLLGTLSGMNRHGVALSLNLVYGERDADAGVPVTFALQRALAGAARTGEALEILEATPFASANNVTICDAAGNAAVLEVGPGRTVRRTLGTAPLCATNHYASCRRRPTLSPISISSHLRYLVLRLGRTRLREEGSRAAVRRALRRVAIPRINLQSMIFEPARRGMTLSMGRVPAARGTFVRLGGRSLWGT